MEKNETVFHSPNWAKLREQKLLVNMSRPKSSFWTLPKPPQKQSFQLEPQIIVTAYDSDPTIHGAYVTALVVFVIHLYI